MKLFSKIIALTILSSTLLVGCSTQNYESSGTYSKNNYQSSSAGNTYTQSKAQNNSSSQSLELTAEEKQFLGQLVRLTDNQIRSIYPNITTEEINYFRAYAIEAGIVTVAQPTTNYQQNYTVNSQQNYNRQQADDILAREQHKLRIELGQNENDRKYREVIKDFVGNYN